MKVDLHSHTFCSKDCCSSYGKIIDAVKRSGVDGIAVTDHNEFDGAVELKSQAPFLVVPGEEIKTSGGEVIGLFLREWIPPNLDPLETVQRIHEQGGLVYVPHPFDRFRGSHITPEALDAIRPHVDLLEVFNARNALPSFNALALDYARQHGLRAGAGSDAHTCGEYGRGYVELEPFRGPEEFLQNAERGTWHGRLSSPTVHLRTRIDRTMKVLGVR